MVLDLGHFLWYIWMVCKFLPSQYGERFVGTYNPRGQMKQLVEILWVASCSLGKNMPASSFTEQLREILKVK